MNLRPRRPGHATIVAYLALFTALGGSAYAAATIGSREIKDNSIRSRDVRNNTLSGRDINERSLRAAPRLYTRLALAPAFAPGNNRSAAIASCDRGDLAVSGATSVGEGNQVDVWSEGPMPNLTGWAADFERVGPNPPGGLNGPQVKVVCARRAPR